MPEKRLHVQEGEMFILESVSDSVVRVTHREQTAYFGLSRDWDSSKPYGWAMHEAMVDTDGIDGLTFPYSTPDRALKALCDLILDDRRREGTMGISPEERKQAARQVLAEFMDDLPVPGPRYPPEVTGRMGREIYERDILHLVEPDHDDEIVAIDVDSGEWAVSNDEMEAGSLLHEKVPEAVNVLCMRAGYRALRSFGGGSRRRPRD